MSIHGFLSFLSSALNFTELCVLYTIPFCGCTLLQPEHYLWIKWDALREVICLFSALMFVAVSTCCICWGVSVSPLSLSFGSPVLVRDSLDLAVLCFPFLFPSSSSLAALSFSLRLSFPCSYFSSSFSFLHFVSAALLTSGALACCPIQFVCVFLYICVQHEANRAHFSRVRQLLCIPLSPFLPLLTICDPFSFQRSSHSLLVPVLTFSFVSCIFTCGPSSPFPSFVLYIIFSCDMSRNLTHHRHWQHWFGPSLGAFGPNSAGYWLPAHLSLQFVLFFSSILFPASHHDKEQHSFSLPAWEKGTANICHFQPSVLNCIFFSLTTVSSWGFFGFCLT